MAAAAAVGVATGKVGSSSPALTLSLSGANPQNTIMCVCVLGSRTNALTITLPDPTSTSTMFTLDQTVSQSSITSKLWHAVLPDSLPYGSTIDIDFAGTISGSPNEPVLACSCELWDACWEGVTGSSTSDNPPSIVLPFAGQAVHAATTGVRSGGDTLILEVGILQAAQGFVETSATALGGSSVDHIGVLLAASFPGPFNPHE